jgi:cell division septal protein FtsQ
MSETKEITRAELVRQRRTKEYTEHIQRASQVTARPAPAAAPRARRNASRSERKPSRGSNARRRFQIALPQAMRPDVRSVGIPRPRFGWRALSFVIVVLLGSLLYLAYTRPELRVTEVQLAGSQLISQAEMNSVLKVAGQPIFALTPSDLETRLRLNYPEFVSVRVAVSLPNQVSVNVTERQPLIRWEQGGGYTWIAADGIAFRPRGETTGLIPVVAMAAPPTEGLASADPMTPTPFISTEMVQTLKGLAPHAPAGVPILYDKDLGFGWDDPRGWRVHFGTKAGDVALKMRVYESMVASLTQRGIRPALINVMYPSAPYYRMSE